MTDLGGAFRLCEVERSPFLDDDFWLGTLPGLSVDDAERLSSGGDSRDAQPERGGSRRDPHGGVAHEDGIGRTFRLHEARRAPGARFVREEERVGVLAFVEGERPCGRPPGRRLRPVKTIIIMVHHHTPRVQTDESRTKTKLSFDTPPAL